MNTSEMPPIITGAEGHRQTKGGIGLNTFYAMMARGEVPGAFNIGRGGKAIWRIKTKPFLAWLEGEEKPAQGAA